MKKFLGLMILFVFLLPFLISCISQNIPLGVWHSEESNMTLFIDPELDPRGGRWGGRFPGIYVQDGVEIDIVIYIQSKDSDIVIEFDRANPIFHGFFVIENDMLHLRTYPSPDGIIEVEFRTIIFDLMEEVTN